MKKVLIINQGNTENYGDIAINKVLSDFYSQNYDVDFIPYWDEKEIFGVFFSKIKLLYKIFMKIPFFRNVFYLQYLRKKTKKHYDYVIVGGGELLSSHKGFNTAVYNIAKFFKNKSDLYMIGVSGNGNLPSSFKKRYIKALKKFEKIYVRDNFTRDVLKNEYNIKSTVYPDVVFAYNKLNNTTIKNKKRSTALLISPICYYDEIGKYLDVDDEDAFIDYILEIISNNTNDYHKAILAPTVKDDNEITRKIYNRIVERKLFENVEIFDYRSLDFYTGLLKRVDKVISCRMHGLILAKIFKCKIETVVFKNKLLVFKREHQLDSANIEEIEEKAYLSLERLLKEEAYERK